MSPSTIDEVKKEFGLDRPLTVQFSDYLGDTARGEFGISYVFSRPVCEVIGTALWPTILLVGVATVGATVIGTLIGIWGAWRRGSPVDTASLGFGLVTYAIRVLARDAPDSRLRRRPGLVPDLVHETRA